MDSAIVAALGATVGFAGGDVFTALFARRVNGKSSMLVLTVAKLLLYLPFMALWWHEFSFIDGQSWAWIILLSVLFTAAYAAFNLAFEFAKTPALVGVIAGCFPASAAVVAIGFLGQRPSAETIVLLLVVLTGVILIGLPSDWRKSLKIDKGIALAFVPMICWGVFGALLNEPVRRIGTAHGWFVVQSTVALLMAIFAFVIYGRLIGRTAKVTTKERAWRFALAAGTIIGLAEASQALALGSGKQLVIVEGLIGSYPAAYFLIAHHIFREELHKRQWLGIGVVTIAIVLLSASATSM